MRYLLLAALVAGCHKPRRAPTAAEIAEGERSREESGRRTAELQGRAAAVAQPAVAQPAAPAKTNEQLAAEVVRAVRAREIGRVLIGRAMAERVDAEEDAHGPTLYIHSDQCNQTFVNALAVNIGNQLRKSGFRRISCQGGGSWVPREAVLR